MVALAKGSARTGLAFATPDTGARRAVLPHAQTTVTTMATARRRESAHVHLATLERLARRKHALTAPTMGLATR